jgi:hypothetical protein
MSFSRQQQQQQQHIHEASSNMMDCKTNMETMVKNIDCKEFCSHMLLKIKLSKIFAF